MVNGLDIYRILYLNVLHLLHKFDFKSISRMDLIILDIPDFNHHFELTFGKMWVGG